MNKSNLKKEEVSKSGRGEKNSKIQGKRSLESSQKSDKEEIRTLKETKSEKWKTKNSNLKKKPSK